jgi:hypothetical protein
MRKFVCAVVVTVCAVSFAVAEDIQVIISKIGDDGTVTYKKTEKGKATGDDLTAKLAKDAKINKGKAKFADGKLTVEVGDPLEKDAVKTLMEKAAESKAKGARAQITVDGGTISQVIFLAGKKGKKGAN